MRRAIGIAFAVTGCSDFDPDLVKGDIVIESQGGETVRARACIGGGLDCRDTKLFLQHDGAETEMRFTGFIFPEHMAEIPIGNALDNYQITNGRGRAVILLPPPFDLGSQERRSVGRDQTVRVTWEPAGMPMKWSFEYACGNGGGFVNGGRADDDEGVLEAEMSILADHLDGDVASCSGAIVLERIRRGSVQNLDADGASGVQTRFVPFTLRL
jgi:hypothetical protein